MPELPEVETIARDLRLKVTGAVVESVELGAPSMLRWPAPEEFTARLLGRTLAGVARRGKYLRLRLDSGDWLVIHLGMSGTLVVAPAAEPRRPHLHLCLGLGGGRQLRFRDPRRFGLILLASPAEVRRHRLLPRLGPEPLAPSFTQARFDSCLAGRQRPLKAVLLDQALIAGVGNIYADEACHRASVRPDRAAGALQPAERRRLYLALRRVLRQGIANRGTSVDQYRDLAGERGQNQERLRVYGRAGLRCLRCRATLAGMRLAGRGTVLCPGCQS
ncbi:MAG: bifunctional DNA-formamidopyrimidine glycosylase/DNA-(apurinic or apyrimidinic site) lyase [Candidatus Dormibacteria bacterium]